MNQLKKAIINDFVKVKNKEDEKNFNLVLKKLNGFLTLFFNKTKQEFENKIDFKANLIGDISIKSNYDFLDNATIMIDYFGNSDDLTYSESYSKKSEIGKMLQDSMHPTKIAIPTTQDLISNLYYYLSLNTKDMSLFQRKNGISLKFFDFKFFIFFTFASQNNNNQEFEIKGKSYNFNFELLHKNLLQKNKETKGKFFDLVKFFKIIERELSLLSKLNLNASKNLYFYENLLYSLDNKIFEGEYIYDIFLKIYDYLFKVYKYENFDNLKNAENNPLFLDKEYKLFAKYYITRYDLKLVLKQSKIFIDNIDEIIK